MFPRHWVKELSQVLLRAALPSVQWMKDVEREVLISSIPSYCGVGVPMDIVRLPSYDESLEMEWFSQHGMVSDSYRTLICSDEVQQVCHRAECAFLLKTWD